MWLFKTRIQKANLPVEKKTKKPNKPKAVMDDWWNNELRGTNNESQEHFKLYINR